MTVGVRRQVTDALARLFRPEFINRIDDADLLPRAGPGPHEADSIDIQIAGLLKRLEDRKIHVDLSDAAKDFVVTEGVRSGLRRAAAQADGSAAHPGFHGAAGARGPVPRRRPRGGRRRGWAAHVRGARRPSQV